MVEQDAQLLLGRRLLIVEDDYMIAVDLARELEGLARISHSIH